ncbi:MAG: hypothetical protein Q4G43_05015 [Mobilicoccus sp.]|nr:hypothetical protein [Mobilicoccus sp.]
MSHPGRGGAPRRVRVTSARASASRYQRSSRFRELEEQTSLGEVYVDSLLTTQRRLSLALVTGVALALVVVPVVLLTVSGAHERTVMGIPLPWLGLGVLVYPFALLITFWYVRAAERVENEFVEFMERP